MKNILLCGATNKSKVQMNDMMNENQWSWGMWLVSAVIILAVVFVLLQKRHKN